MPKWTGLSEATISSAVSSGTAPATVRRGIVVIAAVALLFTAIAPPVGSAGAAGPDAPDDPTLAVDIERDGTTVQYRATVTAPADADRVRIDGAFGVLNVTDRDGLVAARNGYRLADDREEATITLSIDLSEHRDTPLGRVGPDGPFQAGEDWAFAPSPRFHVRWWHDGSAEQVRLRGAQRDSTESAVTAEAPVAVGERFVFLGPHRVERRTVDGQSVRLVVPETASFAVGAERAFALANRTVRAAGNAPRRPATAFVLPDSVRAGGGASGTDLWVRADADERTVAHEFAHTALRLRTTRETRWVSEAAAEYLAYRAVSPGAVTTTLRRRVTDTDAVLADRDSWGDDAVPYRKGAALLALLDERIRTASGGERSLTHVLVRLSASDAAVDTTALEAAVRAVSDDATATWFTGQATSSAPAVRPPEQAGLGGSFDSTIAVSTASQNPLGLLATLGGFSMLVWVPFRLRYRVGSTL